MAKIDWSKIPLDQAFGSEDGAQFEGSCSVIGVKKDASGSLVSKAKPRFTMASPSSEPNA